MKETRTVMDEIKEIVKDKDVNELICMLRHEPVHYVVENETVKKLIVKWLRAKVEEFENDEDDVSDYIANYNVSFNLLTIFNELCNVLKNIKEVR